MVRFLRPFRLRPFSRVGLALMLALVMALVCAAGEAVAKVKRVKREPIGNEDYEAYRSEKLSDEDIRLLEYGKPVITNKEKSWVLEPCRDDIYGTWYEMSGPKRAGELLVAADFMIFSIAGRFQYRTLAKEEYLYDHVIKRGGGTRYLFELESPISVWGNKPFGPYMVFVNPPMTNEKHSSRGGDWTMRCVPDVAVCDDFQSARRIMNDFEFDTGKGCQGIVLAPY
ncbi:MAG: hypothetical protein HZC25_12325 [Rhodospirillales bacterium]|nr:hypothetical protein [Rhodospirillales bacterium]